MKLYFKALILHLRSAMEYRISFLLQLLSQVFVVLSGYVVVYSLFSKFGNIKGFGIYEVLLCYSVINFAFSFNDCFFRGMDKFDNIICNGFFDILLVRPKKIIHQVLIQEIDFNKFARALQYFIFMLYAIYKLNIGFDLLKILTIVIMCISTIVLFLGILIINASYCFLTIQGLEVRNVITYGGRTMAQYPMGIYPKNFIRFFTFVIPFSLVNYYPLLFVLGKSTNIFYVFLPIISLVYLIPCILLFNRGVKKYSSVGC